MGTRTAFGIACVLVATWTASACGSTRPPVVVHEEHRGPIRSRDVARGQHTFRTLCAACHAGRVNPAGYHWSAQQMRQQIREGNALMPALPRHRLSDDNVEAVLAYLSTIGAIDAELPPIETEEDDDTFLAELEAEEAADEEVAATPLEATEAATVEAPSAEEPVATPTSEDASTDVEPMPVDEDAPHDRADALGDPTGTRE